MRPGGRERSRDSDLLMDQLRVIDNRVLVKGPLSRLDEATMDRVAPLSAKCLILADLKAPGAALASNLCNLLASDGDSLCGSFAVQ